MADLNKVFCGSEVKNTGFCDCPFDPNLIIGAILMAKGRVLSKAELADANIAATFETLIHAAKAQRAYPYIVFNGLADNTEEPTIFTSGYGSPEPVREGSYNWLLSFRKGGVNLSNALRSFNGLIGKYQPIFILQGNKMLGTTKKDVNGENGMAGIPLETLYQYPWKAADGTNPAQYRQQFAFRPEYINELVAYAEVSLDVLVLAELEGLETASLEFVEKNGLVYTIKATSDCGAEDLFELHADALANEEAWNAFDNDGEEIEVTNVAKNNTVGGWDITVASTAETISLAPPATLNAAPVNISHLDSEPVDVDETS